MKLPQIDSESYRNYKAYRNTSNRAIANAKRIYYNNLCCKNSNDQKAMWNTVYEIVNPDKKKSSPPTKLKTKSGHVTSDPQVIADTLNHFFTDIGPNMANSITPSSHSFEKFLHIRNIKNSLFLSPSRPTPDELITIVSSLKDKKAIRKYDYETKFIKLAKISIAEFLSKLFNLCLTIAND